MARQLSVVALAPLTLLGRCANLQLILKSICQRAARNFRNFVFENHVESSQIDVISTTKHPACMRMHNRIPLFGQSFKRQPGTALREGGGGRPVRTMQHRLKRRISQQPYVALDGLSIGDAKHGQAEALHPSGLGPNCKECLDLSSFAWRETCDGPGAFPRDPRSLLFDLLTRVVCLIGSDPAAVLETNGSGLLHGGVLCRVS